MKRLLIITALVVLMVVAFAAPALALHTQEADGRRCASCHSTHQGVTRYLLSPTVSNKNLKTTYGDATISTSCLACHDGTQSRGVTGGNERTMFHSGVFDLTGAASGNWPPTANNYSAHQVDISSGNTVAISAAPGNNKVGSPYGTHNNAPLSCASCHNPHGAFGKSGKSWAYLQPNPNNAVVGPFSASNLGWTGKNYSEITLTHVANGEYQAAAADFPWLRPRSGQYLVGIEVGSDWVLMNTSTALTGTKNFSVNAVTGQVKLDGAITAASFGGEYPATLTARVFKPILVQVVDTYNGTIYNPDGSPKALNGIRIYSASINEWCGACHGHYNIASKGSGYPIGEDHFYGHSITNRYWDNDYATPWSPNLNYEPEEREYKRMNCLSCHYAHGTRNDLMVDSLKVLQTGTSTSDRSPANKRYFGGSVCMRCHYDSHGTMFMQDNKDRPEEYQWQ